MSKKARIIYFVLTDAILINMSVLLSGLILYEGIPKDFLSFYFKNFLMITILKIGVFAILKLYRNLLRYASIEELIQIISATVISNIVVVLNLTIKQINLGVNLYILITLIDIFLIGGVRFSFIAIRRYKNSKLMNDKKRVLVIGAGDAGAMVIKEFKNHVELNSTPVAVIDDDKIKKGKKINGVSVVGQRVDIARVVDDYDIDIIVIAMPSASKKEIKQIVNECKKTKCRVKLLPGIYELIDGKVSIKQLRDVEVEDLLGRDQIRLDTEGINTYLKNKKVLVTGGGGSIGSELCRQIISFKPKKLIILDIYENNAYDLQNELKRKFKNISNGKIELKVIIASVRDEKRIEKIISKENLNVVFHAAAHKHVPLMEDNPKEAIKNNVFGTLNMARSCSKYNLEKFVLISTDKAVNPTNIMGASKRLCEMIVQSINKVSKTEFVAVRFGNVLGSNGSVIPLFKKQIKEGGPVTVTHKDVIRYFMTIPEASQLVIQAAGMAKGGEIFVLDMGEPVKIIDLAYDLISLSGLEPEVDIPIKIVGLRPGEKLYEELLMDEEGIKKTKHEKIHIGKPIFTDYNLLIKRFSVLKEILKNGCDYELKRYIKTIVPTYKESNDERNFDVEDEIAITDNKKIVFNK